MAKSGPLIIVEDDIDDQEILEDLLKQLQLRNKRIYFNDCTEAFNYLKTTRDQPFVVFCDINIPGMNGLEFKKKIDEDQQLRAKSIPFVFLSTAIDKTTVDKAYKEMTVQGFFQKEQTMDDLKKTLSLIIDYWKICKHPNSA